MSTDELKKKLKVFFDPKHGGQRRVGVAVGTPAQVGPCQFIKDFIGEITLDPGCYINLNRLLIDSLKDDWEMNIWYDRQNQTSEITRRFKKTIGQHIESHYQNHDALIYDHVELLYKYHVDLPALAATKAIGGKSCLICLPGELIDDRVYFFDKLGIFNSRYCILREKLPGT